MAITFDEKTQTYTVQYGKRHPITRIPKSLKRKGIKSKAEAKRVLEELRMQVFEAFRAPPPGTILYGSLLDKFYASLESRDLIPSTVLNYKQCLNAHTSQWKHRPIDSITTEEIRHLIKDRLADRSPSHRKSMLKFIRGAFNFAVESGLAVRNPVPQIHFRIANKIKRVLTRPQAKLLLEKALEFDHEWYPVWFMALYTGMRNGELHALTWDKVDFDGNTILVSGSWSKKDGFKDLTKSGEDRMIEIAPALKTLLMHLKIQNRESPFVLPRIREWDEGRQAEMLRHFLLGIQLPRIRFHDLRASWATMLLSDGKEPAKVMKLGGWKDIKTMMIYLRKAGIDTRGTLGDFCIHDPAPKTGEVLSFRQPSGSDL